jgi:hypothetical protein
VRKGTLIAGGLILAGGLAVAASAGAKPRRQEWFGVDGKPIETDAAEMALRIAERIQAAGCPYTNDIDAAITAFATDAQTDPDGALRLFVQEIDRLCPAAMVAA